MRLFIAGSLAEEQEKDLLKAQDILQHNARKISLTKAQNLHFTLHFLGETSEEDKERLFYEFMNYEAPSIDSLSSRLKTYGYFKRRDGLLIYADMQVSDEVFQLQRELGEILSKIGFSVEKRPWLPHVTLSRRSRLETKWSELMTTLPVQEEFYNLAGITLFKSEFTSQGMRYTPIFCL